MWFLFLFMFLWLWFGILLNGLTVLRFGDSFGRVSSFRVWIYLSLCSDIVIEFVIIILILYIIDLICNRCDV